MIQGLAWNWINSIFEWGMLPHKKCNEQNYCYLNYECNMLQYYKGYMKLEKMLRIFQTWLLHNSGCLNLVIQIATSTYWQKINRRKLCINRNPWPLFKPMSIKDPWIIDTHIGCRSFNFWWQFDIFIIFIISKIFDFLKESIANYVFLETLGHFKARI